MELPVVNHKDYVAKIGDDHKFPINKFGELAKYLIDKKYLHINEKKLISFHAKDNAFLKTNEIVNKNVIDLSNFVFRVFNQIRIINSN